MTREELVKEVYQVMVDEDGGNPTNEIWLAEAIRYQAEAVVDRLEELNVLNLSKE